MENIVQLPNGYIDKSGKLHRECQLKPLSGFEEELIGQINGPPAPVLVTKLLSRCVVRVGDISPVTESIARQLLIEDRQFLLLQIRAITFGDHVNATIVCPNDACQQKIDIDFNISDIGYEDKSGNKLLHSICLSEQAIHTSGLVADDKWIKIRLPNGGDQEVVVAVAENNESEAFTVLLQRCIQTLGSTTNNPSLEKIKKLSALARQEIEKKMTEIAEGIELSMATHCPHCGMEFTAPFDIQDFFFGELKIKRQQLYKEVHYLAYHYHWSEQAILSMTRNKRRQYIDILADE